MAKILWMDDYAGKGTEQRIGFDGLVYFIEINGHTVEIASTSEQIEETLEIISSYDLLILDIIMDPLNSIEDDYQYQYGGIDVLERLLTINYYLPIILLSVMPSRMIKEETDRREIDLSKVGVKEILRKGSITPTELATIVERILNNKENSNFRGNNGA